MTVLRVVVAGRRGEAGQHLELVVTGTESVAAGTLGDQHKPGVERVAEAHAARRDGRLSLHPLCDAGPPAFGFQAGSGAVECRQPRVPRCNRIVRSRISAIVIAQRAHDQAIEVARFDAHVYARAIADLAKHATGRVRARAAADVPEQGRLPVIQHEPLARQLDSGRVVPTEHATHQADIHGVTGTGAEPIDLPLDSDGAQFLADPGVDRGRGESVG